MKTSKFTTKLLLSAALFGLILSCQEEDQFEPDLNSEIIESESETDESLSAKGSNCTKTGSRNVDLSNPKNPGDLDDRTCFYDYELRTFGTKTFGSYRIKASSITDNSNLSPRMERKFSPRTKPNNGAYEELKATFRIENVGGGRGTYFMQVKGKHEGHVDIDPAIALFIAREVKVGNDTFFDIYREQITKRGGRFSNNGRRDILLTRVKKNENFRVELRTGFKVDRRGKITQHYANAKIKGVTYNFNVPAPEKAFETAIRYGAYSVTSGVARIYVTDASFNSRK